MKSKVLVLGGGNMGGIVANDLAKDYDVGVIDQRPIDIKLDITTMSTEDMHKLFSEYDVIVGALPSKLGYGPLMVAATHGHDYVDLSFTKEPVDKLFQEAWQNLTTIFHDCGLSPGLSNMIAGNLNKTYNPMIINISVGGISKDPNAPYGHVNTWCVEDLLEEYTRPARVMLNDREELIDPLYEGYWKDKIWVDGVGVLEGFISDGLRSLLKLQGPIAITEMTLRRPGHLRAIKPLVKNGTFIETIKKECSYGKDIVVLEVECEAMKVSMVDEATDGLSAMSRTTAFSCSAFTRLLLEGVWKNPGVYAPEYIGTNPECYSFVVDKLAEHGIHLKYLENPREDLYLHGFE